MEVHLIKEFNQGKLIDKNFVTLRHPTHIIEKLRKKKKTPSLMLLS